MFLVQEPGQFLVLEGCKHLQFDLFECWLVLSRLHYEVSFEGDQYHRNGFKPTGKDITEVDKIYYERLILCHYIIVR